MKLWPTLMYVMQNEGISLTRFLAVIPKIVYFSNKKLCYTPEHIEDTCTCLNQRRASLIYLHNEPILYAHIAVNVNTYVLSKIFRTCRFYITKIHIFVSNSIDRLSYLLYG